MTVTYQQNDTAQACSLDNFCSTVGGTIEAGRQAEAGVSAGVTEAVVSVGAGLTDDNHFSFECIVAAGTTGSAGDWTVNVNFSSGDMDVTWESCFVCRVNSSCVNQESIGSSTGLGIATNAGAQNTVISGSAVTLAAGDKVIITLGFTEAAGHSAGNVGITPSTTIVSPFVAPTLQSVVGTAVGVAALGQKTVFSTFDSTATGVSALEIKILRPLNNLSDGVMGTQSTFAGPFEI